MESNYFKDIYSTPAVSSMKIVSKHSLQVSAIKLLGFLVCCAFFIIQTGNIWSHYQEESTVTSTSIVKSNNKFLPCLTFCPYPVFKKPYYPLADDQFEKNAFQWEDIFDEETLQELNITKKWKIYKTFGPLFGNCFTTCFLEPVKSFNFDILYNLKQELNLQLYVHNPGDKILIFKTLFMNTNEKTDCNFV
jgi:hypothetical protein